MSFKISTYEQFSLQTSTCRHFSCKFVFLSTFLPSRARPLRISTAEHCSFKISLSVWAVFSTFLLLKTISTREHLGLGTFLFALFIQKSLFIWALFKKPLLVSTFSQSFYFWALLSQTPRISIPARSQNLYLWALVMTPHYDTPDTHPPTAPPNATQPIPVHCKKKAPATPYCATPDTPSLTPHQSSLQRPTYFRLPAHLHQLRNLYFWALFSRNLYFCALVSTSEHFSLEISTSDNFSLEISTSEHFLMEISTSEHFSRETSTSEHFSLEISTPVAFSLEISTPEHISWNLSFWAFFLKSLLHSPFL